MAEDADWFHEMIPYAHTPIIAMKSMKDWQVFILPEITKPGLPLKTKNLIKLIIADIYASGGRICFGEYLSDPFGLMGKIAVDIKILNIYSNFILSNNALYEGISRLKQVTLLNSQVSNQDNIWPNEVDLGNRRPSFFGGGRLLTDSNVQFDCVFAPYKMFTSFPDFTYQQLINYSVVVLPSTFKLTDEQAQIILDYIKSGGVVVAWRDIGTHNPDGTIANRPELLSLQKGDGVKSYGAGKFVYSSLDLGTAYTWDWGIPHDEIRRRFQDMILPYIKPLIKTENISQVYRPGGATGFLYQDPHGNYILHLVNYDYNEFNDEFAVKEDFILKILADTTKAWQAVYVSPDFLGQQVLPTTNDSGYVSMTIPKLEAYGIVILQENQTAPQVVFRTPSDDFTILAGDSVHFSIQAQDPDHNPLFYQWYVNRQVDSLATDSTYIYRTTRTSSGIDTVTVEVSDGIHKVVSQWLVTIQTYVFPKVLFDENHRQKMSTIWSRANELAPGDPESRSYKKLVERLSKDYIVISDTSGILTSDNLQDINVLIFAAADDDISSDERVAIQQFVSKGGSALFLGDPHWWLAYSESNGNMFRLLQDFGFKTYLSPVRSLDDTLDSSHLYMIDLKGTHPATADVGRVQLEWVHKLETVTAKAKIIESTGNLRVWQDINDNGVKDDDEPLESDIGIVGVSEYENGKVIYISFFRFHDKEIDKNYRLIESVMKWLTADVNPVVSVEREEVIIPESFDLSQNYPNPFNPTTTIRFQLPKHSKVSIKIYDIIGQEVRTLVEKDFEAGYHTVTWDGSNNSERKVASGIYFYRIETEGFIKVKKALLLK